jgi:prepilin-type N-terminal cleavage/methylation domain-containing protein
MKQRERLRAFTLPKLRGRCCALTLLSARAFPRHAAALAKADAFRHSNFEFQSLSSLARHSCAKAADLCPPWLAVAARRRLISKKREQRAFTLIELLVVIAIISILLVALIPALSISKSSGRKGAVSNLLGAIEQARAEAIKSGQVTYVVFPTLTTAGVIDDRYGYKSYAIFQDDPANPAAPKQLTNWKTLPTGISIRSEISASPWASDVSFAFTPEGATKTEKFPYLKFNATGELQAPVPAATPVAVHIFEGYVEASGDKDTSKAKFSETIRIASLTGRAEHVP